MPILDHRVVELAWRLPLAMKIRGAASKWILREVLYRHVPKTLVERPIHMLFREPHVLSAWLSQHRADFRIEGGRVKWLRNPIEVMAMTYYLLDLASPERAHVAACGLEIAEDGMELAL